MEVIATERTRDAFPVSMSFYAQGASTPEKNAAFMERLNGVGNYLVNSAVDPALSEAEHRGFEAAARLFIAYRRDSEGTFIGRVDRTFTESLTLDDPVRPVHAFHPGRANTDGDAVVWVGGARVLATGDIVVAPVPFGFNSYPGEWVKALDILLELDVAVMVPGHGAPMKDRSYARSLRALIEATRARVAPLAQAGKSLEDVRKEVDLMDLAGPFGGDDPWLRRWFRGFWVDPMIEAAWKEAKGIPIEQGRG